MFGFWEAEVKLLGPVQLYAAPATVDAVRVNVDPAQIALLLPAAGDAGMGLTITATVPGKLVHPPLVVATLYVPAAVKVAPGMEVF